MKQLQCWLAWLLGCAATLLLIHDSQAQSLTGSDRMGLIGGIVDTCMRQHEPAGTEVVPKRFFEQYCRCFANGLADRIPATDIVTGNSAVVRSVIQAEGKRCHDAMKAEMLRAIGR